MIMSILDTDLYKLTMQQAVCEQFPRVHVWYKFFNRDLRHFPAGFKEALREKIQYIGALRLLHDEKTYLKEHCPYLTPVYIDFLSGYKFNPNEVLITQDSWQLSVEIRGPWYRTILWEVPLLATISELYYEMTNQSGAGNDYSIANASKKSQRISEIGCSAAEFGTRRRFSSNNQFNVVGTMKHVLSGTSNVYLAMKHLLKAIGTQAHEWTQAMAAMFGYKSANRIALEKWAEVYKGDLGIALSDTFTSGPFFDAFDLRLAKLFDGVRHDSGDPIYFAGRVVEHYKKLGIDPTTKTIVFSDSLDLDKVLLINSHCNGVIKDSYGIGTNFSNDVGVKPLNIVIKLTGVSLDNGRTWVDAIKLSDDEGKNTGNPEEVKRAKEILNLGEV